MKMREAWKRRRLIPVSAETRLKMSLARKGRPRPPEVCAKISASNKTSQKVAEQRKRLIAAITGRPRPDLSGSKSIFWVDGRSLEPGYWRAMHSIKSQRRRAQGRIDRKEWIAILARFNNQCPACGRSEPEIVLTIDHITPLVCDGTNNSDNLQPLCRSCNSRKKTQTIRYEPYGQYAS